MKRGEFEENLAMLMGSGITYHKMKSEDAIRTEYLRLTAEVAQLRELWHNITMRCQEREQEVARLRAALEWYADPANYGRGGCPGNLQLGETWATREVMIWKRDNGQRAREALEVKP